MTNEEFTSRYWPKYRNAIEAIARKTARSDADLYDDLVAVGTIALLTLVPEKARTNQDAFIRNCIRNKIVDHMRWLNRRDFDRLDVYLAHQHDLVQDPISGEPMLVHGDNELVAAPGYLEDGSPKYTSKSQRLLAIREYAGGRDDDAE